MCCYKWQPWNCLGLDVTNLIIFIYKNGRKIPKPTGQLVKIRPKRKEMTLNFTCAWFLEFVTSSHGAL